MNEEFDLDRQEIVLKPGEAKTFYARPYLLKKLYIPNGAKLIVPPGGRNWLLLDVDGDCHVDGKIIFREFAGVKNPIYGTAPNGDQVQHEFSYYNLGGEGGRGGNFQGKLGGQGANGTVDYGGGGGGGGWKFKLPKPSNGNPGNGRNGGAGPYSSLGEGGDGGRRARRPNGGLIYLNVTGKLTGNGILDVRGTRGEDGTPGNRGSNPAIYGAGGGGGGAGGPGGSGGSVVIRAPHNHSNLNIKANGGEGGAGSSGGRAALPGSQGDPGDEGVIIFL